MKQMNTLALAASAATLFTACLFQGESDGKARASVRMDIKASSSAALAKSTGLFMADSTGARIVLTDARLAVSRIKFHSESDTGECDTASEAKDPDCDDEDNVAFAGPFLIDLLTGASTPALGTGTVPAGVYRKVKIELHHGQNDTVMGGQTLVANGTVVLADGTSRPFHLALTFTENLKIESKSGMPLVSDSVNTVAVRLMTVDWLKGIDIAACLGSAGAGDLVITEGSALGKCLDAEHRIKDNFRASFHAHKQGGADDKEKTK